jgi:peroxiredoxin
VAVSVDPPEATKKHLARTGWTYTFLSDSKLEALRRYDLVHHTNGQDIARPAEFLIDPTGTVRWVDKTDDFRIRTRPETVLQVFDRLKAGER